MGRWRGDSKNVKPPIGPRQWRVALCAVEGIDTVDLLGSSDYSTAIKAPNTIKWHSSDPCGENKVTVARKNIKEKVEQKSYMQSDNLDKTYGWKEKNKMCFKTEHSSGTY